MIKRVSFHVNNSEALFFASLAIYLFVMITRQSFLAIELGLLDGHLYRVVLFVCILLLALKEYIKNKLQVLLLLYGLILSVLIIIIKDVETFAYATGLLYILSARDVPFRRIAKVALITTLFTLMLIILLSLTGVIENYLFEKNTDRPREFLGFFYALYAPAFFLNVVTLVFYLNRGRTSIWVILFELIFNKWLYIKTDSRLSYLLCLMIIAITVFLKLLYVFRIKYGMIRHFKFSIIKGFISACIVFMFVITAVIGIYININYNENNDFQAKLNRVLTQRLHHGQLSYEKYGFKMFGQEIRWIGHGLDNEGRSYTGEKDYLYVDNLYLQILQKYGLVFSVICLILVTVATFMIFKERNWVLLFVLAIIAAHALIDDLVFYIYYNSFWLALAPYLFVRREQQIKEEVLI